MQEFFAASQARHSHLCPRQVLGVRIALAGLKQLDMDSTASQRIKHLMVISETDGCFVDGIEVTAHVSVGHRSLKIEDYGKIAATFVDLKNHRAVRLRPALGVRELATVYCPEEKRAYFAQLKGYQLIPDPQLLIVQWITLNKNIQQIVGSLRQRAYCVRCGEEIINGREVMESGMPVCIACAGHGYYQASEVANTVQFNTDKIPTL